MPTLPDTGEGWPGLPVSAGLRVPASGLKSQVGLAVGIAGMQRVNKESNLKTYALQAYLAQ